MSFWGPGVRRYRWDSFAHGTLYDFVNSGRGAAAVEEADQAWTEFTALLVESKATVDRALREAGAEWQGQAADLASAGVSPLTDWAEQAADAGAATKASLQDIAQAFAHTAYAMPEPVAVPSRATQGIPPAFADIIDGQHDEDVIARHAQQAHLHAIELMTAYNLNNIDSASTTGTFDDPPEIGVTTENGSPVTGSRSDVIVTPATRDDGGTGPGPAAPEAAAPEAAQPEPGQGEPPPGTGPVDPARHADNPFRTGPADVSSGPPALPTGGSGVSGTSPVVGNPVSAVTGALVNPGRPHDSGGGGPRTGGPLAGRPGVDRGTRTVGESTARGGPTAGRGNTTTFGPVTGTSRREEDEERTSPDYLRDFHDEYWEGTPPVSPPVIGKDDG